MSETENPKQKADDLLNALRKGKSVFDMFSDSFRRNYLIAGRTLESWEKEFKIIIPQNLEPASCKQLDIKLLELHQEAAFFKATSDAIVQALKKGSETEFRNRFTGLVQDYKLKNQKLPASATLEALAKTQIDDVDAALMSAKVAADFWSSVIDHLVFCRKILEQAMIGSGIEAKLQQRG